MVFQDIMIVSELMSFVTNIDNIKLFHQKFKQKMDLSLCNFELLHCVSNCTKMLALKYMSQYILQY